MVSLNNGATEELPGDTHHEKRVDGGKGLEDALVDVENRSLYRE